MPESNAVEARPEPTAGVSVREAITVFRFCDRKREQKVKEEEA